MLNASSFCTRTAFLVCFNWPSAIARTAVRRAAVERYEEQVDHATAAVELIARVHREMGPGFWQPDHLPQICISLEVIFYQRVLGSALVDCGRHEEAIVAFRQACEGFDRLSPEENEFAETQAYWYVDSLHQDFADCLVALDRFDEATKVLAAYADRCGQRVDALPGLPNELRRKATAQAQLGHAFFVNGDTAKARSAFQVAIELLEKLVAALRPASPLDRHQLALLLSNCPVEELRRPERAIKLTQSVVDKQSTDPNVTRLMGLSFYRVGRYGEAMEWLEKTLSLRQQQDEADALLLCLANAKLGRKKDAREWHQRSLFAGREARENTIHSTRTSRAASRS